MTSEEIVEIVRKCKSAAFGISLYPNVDNTVNLKNLLFNIGKLEGYFEYKLKLKDIEINKIEYVKKTVQPQTKKELIDIINLTIKERGDKADLNFIDTSKITDMSWMFNSSKFNGDISNWDVSNVEDMSDMFCKSKFNKDISKWDVSKVKSMSFMFQDSIFNGDISKWDVSNVEYMNGMFRDSEVNGDISKWNVSKVISTSWMFDRSPLENKIEYQPTFKY